MGRNPSKEPNVVTEIVGAIEEQPILTRLEFVSTLICSKIDAGEHAAEEHGAERPFTLMMANGIIRDVIDVLKGVSIIADLHKPKGP
jgi:hypothetical protein